MTKKKDKADLQKEGRKPFFNTVDELQTAIDAYFVSLELAKKFPTITGLAYSLGFESRQSFYDYEKIPEFSYSIKRARMNVEQSYEEGIRSDKSPAGCIFALKNFGWTDKSELEHSGNINSVVTKINYIKPDGNNHKTDS